MRTKLVGTIGVDSGQVMICDPCYVLKGDYDGGKNEYSRACEETLKNEAGPITLDGGGDAVVSMTAYGDGTYPVYAEERDGRIVSLTIKFE